MPRRCLANAILGAIVIVLSPQALFPQTREETSTWTNLLEADDFKGRWSTDGNWRLDADGVASLTPRPGEQGWRRFDAYLWSKTKFEDFEIEFDYKVEPQGNSGFYFRVGDKASPVEHGIEVQIFDSYGKSADAKLTDHDSGGIIPGIPPSENSAKPAGEWNRFRIRVEHEQLTVILNGKTVNRLSLEEHPTLRSRPQRGYIGFQDHGMPLALRRIRVRVLD